MSVIVFALRRSLAMFTDPGAWGIFLASSLLAVAVLLAAAFLVWLGIDAQDAASNAAVQGMAEMFGVTLALWLGGLLLPFCIPFFIYFFLDKVAGQVERRYYPETLPPRDASISESILNALKIFGVFLLVNLIALPFYLVFMFIPPAGLLLYYLVNGYLLGREFFSDVALRHHPLPEASTLRRQHRGTITLAGSLTALALTLPIVNLFAPIFAMHYMVHLYHGLQTRRPERQLLTGR